MPADGSGWYWFWCSVVSGWEPDVKQKVTELFGEHSQAKAAAGQCRWRVERCVCEADEAAFAAKLRSLAEVGVEYSFLRIADCSLARQRPDRRRAGLAPAGSETELAGLVHDSEGAVLHVQQSPPQADDDASDCGGDTNDDDDEATGPDAAGDQTAAASSWRLARIRETSRDVSAATLLSAMRIWRAHERQFADSTAALVATVDSGPVRFRVTAKRGGKGHDFGSDDVKREAALGLIASDAVQAAQLQPALRDYQISLRAQVHRKSFVLGFPLHTEPFHAHQGRRFKKAPISAASTVAADHICTDESASAPSPRVSPLQSKIKSRKSSMEADLLEWLPCRLAELGLSDSYPRDARDLVTPLHEMAYSEQVARKQHEMTRVLKRMARKVRHAWQTHEKSLLRKQRAVRTAQAEAATTDVGMAVPATYSGAEPEPAPKLSPAKLYMPLWVQPRDGELFLQMQPLRHCGMEANAMWRTGYRNKVELAVGIADAETSTANDSAVTTVGTPGSQEHSRCNSSTCKIAVGFQVQHREGEGSGSAQQKPRRAQAKTGNEGCGGGGKRSQRLDPAECAATRVVPLTLECLPSAVSPAMFAIASAFEAFVGMESALPIFEPKVGGNKVRADGVGFWIGVTLRCSRSGEHMVMVRVNGCHLVDDERNDKEDGQDEERRDDIAMIGCGATWLAESVRLHEVLTSALNAASDCPASSGSSHSPDSNSSVIVVVRYEGVIPPMAAVAGRVQTLTGRATENHNSTTITEHASALTAEACPADRCNEDHHYSDPVAATIEEELLGLKFRISPEAFFQVHTEAAERLVSTLCECTRRSRFAEPFAKEDCGDANSDTHPVPLLLDVCCGAGTLGLILARYCGCKQVRGIESCEPAVEDARVNAQLNQLGNIAQFECGNAESKINEILRQASDSSSGCGGGGVVAIVDPPRTGLKPTVCAALRKQPAVERVVFVSCNPHGHQMRFDYTVKGGSLIDNAVVLCGPPHGTKDSAIGAPFRPAFAQAVDLFPDTPHCELVVVFDRESHAK